MGSNIERAQGNGGPKSAGSDRMNLRRLLSWKKPAAELSLETPEPVAPGSGDDKTAAAGAGNVVAFPLRGESHEASGDVSASAMVGGQRSEALIGAPEFREFFEENHFGFGRHNGSHHRTHEALDLGRQERIARFQNITARLVAARQAKLSRLKAESIAVEGISPVTSAQLELACHHVAGEIQALREQAELASHGSGWVREALTRYEAGFTRGLREALDFDSLVR
jgi:hypothetical protein